MWTFIRFTVYQSGVGLNEIFSDLWLTLPLTSATGVSSLLEVTSSSLLSVGWPASVSLTSGTAAGSGWERNQDMQVLGLIMLFSSML